MPYFHVIIGSKSRPHEGTFEVNLLEQDLVNNIVKPCNKGEDFKCGDSVVSPDDISYIKITESEESFHLHTYFVSRESYFADHWQAINRMKNVTGKFIKTLPQRKKEPTKETMTISKNVFIVHGRDHKPMKELKAMLYEFGVHPIVLHEQPSGSRTIVEKLEKYSDVGYAFVILTPDDFGCSVDGFELPTEIKELRNYPLMGDVWVSPDDVRRMLSYRARQNVVLEFGYFIGLLGRDRVCCLHKGNVELPSDMHGIVYIPFESSVEEIRLKIMKELK
ncbi:nucleotide-binding protein, partial [Candidatus Bathyarchaeota archaeon]|nr:nucleotide-binding protein [Candidatus Bathyarchaeota archaeon]